MSDRLLYLSAMHQLLQIRGYRTVKDVLGASQERLRTDLHKYHERIMALIEAGQSDVMWALFSGSTDWAVSRLDTEPQVRMLTIHRRDAQMTTAADLPPEPPEWAVGVATPRWRRIVPFWPLLVALTLIAALLLAPR